MVEIFGLPSSRGARIQMGKMERREDGRRRAGGLLTRGEEELRKKLEGDLKAKKARVDIQAVIEREKELNDREYREDMLRKEEELREKKRRRRRRRRRRNQRVKLNQKVKKLELERSKERKRVNEV
ncbi:hypothetical protein K432DRAFT_409971 [Lepidopterella palustris CBS 459.81]|uniref:Uncharacterized protein n=1 Tax=Lepidopterella palustris CBS 459.81 TaxID=1314670 RepID=A0A8E2DZ83_9PEZI|nr:hypothetical protein K432DRAFT_409971 [Lepidopterella palustris CBS 459.81]